MARISLRGRRRLAQGAAETLPDQRAYAIDTSNLLAKPREDRCQPVDGEAAEAAVPDHIIVPGLLNCRRPIPVRDYLDCQMQIGLRAVEILDGGYRFNASMIFPEFSLAWLKGLALLSSRVCCTTVTLDETWGH